MGKKLRVAVLYGGRSGEHEVSLRSAASVIKNLDRNKFEVLPVAIDKQGKWQIVDLRTVEDVGDSLPVPPVSPVPGDAPVVVLPPSPPTSPIGQHEILPLFSKGEGWKIDVVFPVMHGPLCEDGTLQGLLELAEVPYVGCGVLASAVGMDKDVSKRLARMAGIPVVDSITVRDDDWRLRECEFFVKVESELGYPCFVKPVNMGSSVGVHKVHQSTELKTALQDAFKYDSKVLIEKSVDAREIEVSVLQNPESGSMPVVSVPGEIAPNREFYSYEAKYIDADGAALMIPAKLSAEQIAEAQRIAREVFIALEGEGLARVDMFLDRKSGKLYFNEVNTMPGFTSISMYPKLLEASGISYQELLTKLIDLALARHEKKNRLTRSGPPF